VKQLASCVSLGLTFANVHEKTRMKHVDKCIKFGTFFFSHYNWMGIMCMTFMFQIYKVSV
jgi:hypothetical protein